MTASARFTLDTNILIYAVDRDAGERHAAAVDLVSAAACHDCVLTVQVLGEFFHATTRKSVLDPKLARAFTADWMEVFEVVAADQGCFVAAADVVIEHRLSFWDAMLCATARAAGCAAIISEDMQDGRRLGGVEIVNPFTPDAAERLARFVDG